MKKDALGLVRELTCCHIHARASFIAYVMIDLPFFLDFSKGGKEAEKGSKADQTARKAETTRGCRKRKA